MQKSTPRGDVTRPVYAEYTPDNHVHPHTLNPKPTYTLTPSTLYHVHPHILNPQESHVHPHTPNPKYVHPHTLKPEPVIQNRQCGSLNLHAECTPDNHVLPPALNPSENQVHPQTLNTPDNHLHPHNLNRQENYVHPHTLNPYTLTP